MVSKINTAVFPVAGVGTRFLPVTKSAPKEMLPIVDKPLIQYVVEEAVSIGIKRLVFVTSHGKRAIEDYFDRDAELENLLAERNKQAQLEEIRSIVPNDVSVIYVRQSQPLGLGHAVLCAAPVVGNEPFAVLLADDIIQTQKNAPTCLQDLAVVYQQTGSSVLAVTELPMIEAIKYGVVVLSEEDQSITNIVEKPALEESPSNLASVGRYILTPRIFDILKDLGPDKRGEIQLADAIGQLLLEQKIHTSVVKGTRFDCGSKQGFVQATIAFALQREDLRAELLEFLKTCPAL